MSDMRTSRQGSVGDPWHPLPCVPNCRLIRRERECPVSDTLLDTDVDSPDCRWMQRSGVPSRIVHGVRLGPGMAFFCLLFRLNLAWEPKSIQETEGRRARRTAADVLRTDTRFITPNEDPCRMSHPCAAGQWALLFSGEARWSGPLAVLGSDRSVTQGAEDRAFPTIYYEYSVPWSPVERTEDHRLREHMLLTNWHLPRPTKPRMRVPLEPGCHRCPTGFSIIPSIHPCPSRSFQTSADASQHWS